jgi:hypothetical protein
MVRVAGKLQHARRPIEQCIELFAGLIVGETCAVMRTLEWQDRLQLPAKVERNFGSNLVSAVGDRRYKSHPWFEPGKAIALGLEECPARFLDTFQYVADAIADHGDAALSQHLGSMSGDADAQNEWHGRGSLLGCVSLFALLERPC